MTIKLGYFSDLHLNHYSLPVQQKILANLDIDIARTGADILINAGDTADGGHRPLFDDWLGRLTVPYSETPGNHDFYDPNVPLSLFEKEQKHGDLRIAMTTLWSDCHNDPVAEMWYAANMTDCKAIPSFSIALMKKLHESNRNFLATTEAPVWVTHNPVCEQSIAPAYKTQHLANKCFVPDLSDIVLQRKPPVVIHGHVHWPSDYILGDTRIVANPLGYPGEIYKNVDDFGVKVVEIPDMPESWVLVNKLMEKSDEVS